MGERRKKRNKRDKGEMKKRSKSEKISGLNSCKLKGQRYKRRETWFREVVNAEISCKLKGTTLQVFGTFPPSCNGQSPTVIKIM
jgi:hypothetical protein